MPIVDDHIIESLPAFLDVKDGFFDRIKGRLQEVHINEHLPLFRYLTIISQQYHEPEINGIDVLHLHFAFDVPDDVKLAIAAFLIIAQFENHSTADEREGAECGVVEESVRLIRGRLQKISTCPEGASGAGGGNRIFRNWKGEVERIKMIHRFYNSLNKSLTLTPRTLFNCQLKIGSRILEIFDTVPVCLPLSAEPMQSYVGVNCESIKPVRTKKFNDVYLLRLIREVILFDGENSVKRFADFNWERLIQLNSQNNTQFKRFFLITFGKQGNSLFDLQTKASLVKERFKIPDKKAYTILPSEMAFFQNLPSARHIDVELFEPGECAYWNDFLKEINIRDMYELRSIKLLNIYSMALSADIKEVIVNEIFDHNDSDNLVSFETKQAISEMREDEREAMKKLLSNTIDFILERGWLIAARSMICEGSQIVIPEEVLHNAGLSQKVAAALGTNGSNKFLSWSKLDLDTESPVTILAYRDQGKLPFHFSPNLLESKLPRATSARSLFIQNFFGSQYAWATFNLEIGIYRSLDHEIRKSKFDWMKLKRKIDAIRPVVRDMTSWPTENQYVADAEREMIKIRFRSVRRTKSYPASEFFVTKFLNEKRFRVMRLNELASLDLAGQPVSIQHIDETHESINVYERLVDLDQQQKELRSIQQQFEVFHSSPEKLWKALLKRKAESGSSERLYDELKEHLKKSGLKVVSYFHFCNNWIDPESESLTPLSNKVFISLCQYLQLPDGYYHIMQIIRNTSKQASRQSTQQMNNLLSDLFNDGCFDDLSQTKQILTKRLSKYKQNHPLDQFGVFGTDDKHALENLSMLVELISTELKLAEVVLIEKS